MSRDVANNGSSSVDDRIDERCDAFESTWRSGGRPNIADFIGPNDEHHRNKLFCELLLVDLEYRRSFGEQPTQEQYLDEFPEYAAQIDATSFQYGTETFSKYASNGDANARVAAKQTGSRIAHFELRERLGAGSMGEVWKAWDTRLQRFVKLKLPHSRSLAENDLRRFLREGQSTAQLNHPQLASVHEVGRDGYAFYIVANYIEGENLRDYASRRTLSYCEIANLCAEIAEALQHAHDEGVVHRDLKPANIVVDRNSRPHVIDFGLAKWSNDEHELTIQGELLGTLGYMSPEQARGDGANADLKSDVYSLGVILYELLTGHCPFGGDRQSVIQRILLHSPVPPRMLCGAIPRDLETICLKAIEKEPARRYENAREMAADLRRFASGEAILARRPAMHERCWRWIARRPAIVVLTLLLGVVLVGASMKIASLQREKLRLAGFRPVHVTTTPSGAYVALVPIDRNTNEPSSDPALVVRPFGKTPLMTSLRPGDYLVEAVIPNGDTQEFAEVYRSVPDLTRLSSSTKRFNLAKGFDPETCHFSKIRIVPQSELIQTMVEVSIPERLRQNNPLLPARLYVDPHQTTPAEKRKWETRNRKLPTAHDKDVPYISYFGGAAWAESNHKRLPSAAEYDAIVAAVEDGQSRFVESSASAKMDDLFDDVPEWTTTIISVSNIGGNGVTKHLQGMHLLKGYKYTEALAGFFRWPDGSMLAAPEEQSPKISIRGVRSATPRFVKVR